MIGWFFSIKVSNTKALVKIHHENYVVFGKYLTNSKYKQTCRVRESSTGAYG
jgi:hypothetical protein